MWLCTILYVIYSPITRFKLLESTLLKARLAIYIVQDAVPDYICAQILQSTFHMRRV
jgi:hypothetical protein